ncbi:MAG: hypothetical protein IKG23_02540 [Clostridia bacterium]|nr:hypothetical protein [Clostridia bacterium]
MKDREKVIRLLHEIAEYFMECRSNASFASKAENHFWELQNAASDAVELLKEQEPIIPSVGGSNDPDGHSWWYQCGKCKMPIDYGDRFCRRCGRAVKWDGSSSEIPNS